MRCYLTHYKTFICTAISVYNHMDNGLMIKIKKQYWVHLNHALVHLNEKDATSLSGTLMDKFVFDGQTANKGNDGIPAADMRFYCDKNTQDQFVVEIYIIGIVNGDNHEHLR